ncbi:hypothetical protein POTOM_062149 [Populus tomentosa]|uniref:F-box domain-containing protein n=1 Tax=Populus tomentosa TaxID=118781 RepID=A0A8X7XP93_POPTO|nr:hypothetical protein POTOM_062149 [Populus tomentosa]
MALARVDETLTAVSTTLVDPDNNTEPMFLVQIVSESRKETWVRVRGQSLAMQVDDNRPTAADPTSYLFQIPCQVVAQPASCFHYIAHMISCSDFSASLSNDLASKIAAFSDNLVRAGCFGFFVLAHVEVVEGTFHVVEPIFDTDRHVTVSTGASERVLKKLEKETFYTKQGRATVILLPVVLVCQATEQEKSFKRNSWRGHISELCDEILERILRKLPITTLIECRYACKSWRDIISDSHFVSVFVQCYKKPMRHCDVLSVYYRRIKVSDWVYHMGLLYSPVYVAAFFIACRGLATTVPYVTYCCHFPYVLLYI